jgi:uncharacterized membrane protein
MGKIARSGLVFLTGGLVYFCLELAWRGWSHPVMIAVGGACFAAVGALRAALPGDFPLGLEALAAAACITAVELISGLVLNRWLGLGIWSYAGMPGNLWGQICPQYALLWYLLAFPALLFSDLLRRRLG